MAKELALTGTYSKTGKPGGPLKGGYYGGKEIPRRAPQEPIALSALFSRTGKPGGSLIKGTTRDSSDRRTRLHKALDRVIDSCGGRARDDIKATRYRNAALPGPSYFPEKGGPRYEVRLATGEVKRVCSSARECVAAAKEIASYLGSSHTVEAVEVQPKTYNSKKLYSTRGSLG